MVEMATDAGLYRMIYTGYGPYYTNVHNVHTCIYTGEL